MRKLLVIVLAVGFFVGCKKQEAVNECTYDACAVKAPASEIQAVQTYLQNNNITATQHCSGMFFQIDSAGTGQTPDACSYISVRYRGMLTNGSVFDSTNTPTQFFPLANTIRGWINGVPLIKEGGSVHLYIPPSLGYGSEGVKDRNGNTVIPGNAILVFDVKLDGVVK